MPSLCNAGQKAHPLLIRCDDMEGLRSRGYHPNGGTDLPAKPLARCCQERTEI